MVRDTLLYSVFHELNSVVNRNVLMFCASKNSIIRKGRKLNVIIKGKRRKMSRERGYICKERYRKKRVLVM